MEVSAMRGIITFFHTTKGFGFIQSEAGDKVFFHVNQRHPDELGVPQQDLTIYFEIKVGEKGPVAVHWRLTPTSSIEINLDRDRKEGYRPGVLIAYCHGDEVLLGKRRGAWTLLHSAFHGGTEHADAPDWMFSWGVPQGGIDEGETCEEAIRRELNEELGDYGHSGWCSDLSIQPLFKERSTFRVEKDGRVWNGKALYAFQVRSSNIPDEAFDWMYGDRQDEFWTFPTPAFEGGVQFYKPQVAQKMIRSTQRGPKGAQLIRLLESAQAA